MFATVVGHRCLHTASCDVLFQSRHFTRRPASADRTAHSHFQAIG